MRKKVIQYFLTSSYWTPLIGLDGLVAYWSADHGSGSRLIGASGTGKNASNPVVATQPEKIANYINGHAALKFNITSEHHLDFGDITLTDFSIYLVYKKIDDIEDYQTILSGQSDGTLKGELYTDGDTAVGLGVKDNAANKLRLSKLKHKSLHVATLQNDKIYLDGVEITDYETADTLTALILSRLGARTDSTSNFFNGFFLEAAIYSEKHSYADVISFHEYAINRYNIKFPTAIVSVGDKHIEYSTGVYQFGFDNAGHVFFSSNSGLSFTTYDFTDSAKIESGYIFDNGNLFFTVRNKLYGSTNGCATITEIVPKDLNGDDYIPHTPANATYPGIYYAPWEYIKKTYPYDVELAVWSNYGGNFMGASPINCYSCDENLNVKVIYQWGVNPIQRDDGTMTGGVTGTELGDPTNPAYVSHNHSICFDADNNDFWFMYGDQAPAILKIHYSSGGVWTPTIMWDDTYTNRWWGQGLQIHNGIMFWGTDYSPLPNKGIIRCKVEDLLNIEGHELLFDPDDFPTVPDSEVYDLFLDSLDGIGIVTFNHQLFMTQNGFKNYKEITDDLLTGISWPGRVHKVGVNRFQFEQGYGTAPAGGHYYNSMYLDLTLEGTVVLPDGKPSALSVTNINYTTQRIDFTIGSTNHDGHIIEYSLDGSTWTTKGAVTGSTATYTANGLNAGTLYYWRARAYKNTRYSTESNIASETTVVPPTSYDNMGGKGDRRAIITMSSDGFEYAAPYNVLTTLIDGVTDTQVTLAFQAIPVSGHWLQFDFGKNVIIDEAKFYGQVNKPQGVWRWQGKVDGGSSFVNIGDTFTLQGVPVIGQTMTTLSVNFTGYRYYRLLGVSGNGDDSAVHYEMEFKILDA